MGKARSRGTVFVAVGDVIDLRDAEQIRRKNGDSYLRIMLRSESRKNSAVAIAEDPDALKLIIGRVTKILWVKHHVRMGSHGWRNETDFGVELENAFGETPTLKAEPARISMELYQEKQEIDDTLPEFTYGSVKDAKEKE